MELKPSDNKLLEHLYHNYREPLTKIAKATNLSREQVNYKLSRYLSSGLIKSFFTYFDYSKLGYELPAFLFIKFERQEHFAAFSKMMNNHRNCMSWGEAFSKYDMYLNCIFKDEKELNQFIASMVSSPNHLISEYLVIRPHFTELYPVKFFGFKRKERLVFFDENSEKSKLDGRDLEILKMLAKDSRARIVDISAKLNISSELALYKLRKLKKEGIILGSRAQFDMKKLGCALSIILLNIRNFSTENQEKVRKFAAKSDYVNAFTLSLTKPNCIIQMFHREESDLIKTLKEIKELFKGDHVDVEIVLIKEEDKINTLPFL